VFFVFFVFFVKNHFRPILLKSAKWAGKNKKHVKTLKICKKLWLHLRFLLLHRHAWGFFLLEIPQNCLKTTEKLGKIAKKWKNELFFQKLAFLGKTGNLLGVEILDRNSGVPPRVTVCRRSRQQSEIEGVTTGHSIFKKYVK